MSFRIRNSRPKAGIETAIQQRRDEAKIQITKALDDIAQSGIFAIYKGTNELDPFLHVPGFGDISLPLSASQARQLSKVTHQSLFGDGSQAEGDLASRNTHELNYGEFRIRNPKWHAYLTTLVAKAASTMGIGSEIAAWICPELSKMLLYGPGAHLQRHQE